MNKDGRGRGVGGTARWERGRGEDNEGPLDRREDGGYTVGRGAPPPPVQVADPLGSTTGGFIT